MDSVFLMLAGLGLFLYGVELLSLGLQRVVGLKLKGFLRALAPNRFMGVLSGAITTAIAQSSTVTTVMVVSFVNTGLMALPQAIAVILGAHIGTTLTAQLIAFHIGSYFFPGITLGAFFRLFGRSERMKSWGDILFGLGILFFGLELMSSAFAPLNDNPVFHEIFARFAEHPMLGLFAGMMITIVVQSSSITTGVTIALALSSMITFQEAVPLILGENIGTTITANIAAISGSYVAKQAARAHFVTSAIAAVLALVLIQPFMNLVLKLSPAQDIARQIANAHTIFNILGTLIFLPFIHGVARLTTLLIARPKKEEEELYYLDRTSLLEPGTAIDQVKTALSETLHITHDYFLLVQEALLRHTDRRLPEMIRLDAKTSRYVSRISAYMEAATRNALPQALSRQIPRLVRVLHEIERIHDYHEKMREVAVKLQSEGRKWNATERSELKRLFTDTERLLRKTQSLILSPEAKQRANVIDQYPAIRRARDGIREQNRKRILSRRIEITLANYTDDVTGSLEEIAKKCRNIAEAMIE